MNDYDSISKICSDYLRETCDGLKASHARELVAAFFGYKSHAALLADNSYSIEDLADAAILIPDVGMLTERRRCLKGLPEESTRELNVADNLAEFLQAEQVFSGEVLSIWDRYDLGEYMMEEYLPQHLNPDLDTELAHVIDESDAVFDEVEYEDADVSEHPHGIRITVRGVYTGIAGEGDDLTDETIDFEVEVYLPRVAGHVAFGEPEIEVSGVLRSDADEDDEDEEGSEDYEDRTDHDDDRLATA